MKTIFADAGYWVAMLNPQDERSAAATETTRGLGEVQFVTTQEVLTEVLNFLSAYGPAVRRQAAEAIREILTAGNVTVVAPSPEGFLEGLEAYESTDAPSGTLTDCISASTMRQEGIEDVLTTDARFAQSGFRLLMG
jgi:predicted nucleic acid-binding protein